VAESEATHMHVSSFQVGIVTIPGLAWFFFV